MKLKFVGAVLLLLCSSVYPATYDPATNRLTIPLIGIGPATYKNVVVTVASIVGMNTGIPKTTEVYDVTTGVLTIPRITVGGAIYKNISVKVGTVLSAAVAPAGFVAIASGLPGHFAIKTDGSLWAWGSNQAGVFGDGTYTDSDMPRKTGTGYAAVAVGAMHAVGLKLDGSLWTWGDNSYGQLGIGTAAGPLIVVPRQIGTGYAAISAGEDHSVALKPDGSLWAWGNNEYGQLGDGTIRARYTPVQIGTGYTDISAGSYYTLALKSDGSLWAWGKNDSGEFGDGSRTNGRVPKQIGTGYSAIAAGAAHTVALKSDGSVWEWSRVNGQLQVNPVQTGTGFTAIGSGSGYTVGLKPDGSLWTWGSSPNGALGDGDVNPGYQSREARQIDKGYTTISVNNHPLALKTDGSLWTWGDRDWFRNYAYAPTVFDDVPPGVPTGVTATAASASQVNLAWTASTDNVGVRSYKIYRNNVNVGFLYTKVVSNGTTTSLVLADGAMTYAINGDATVNTTSYPDTGLIGSTNYSYTIAACDAFNNCSNQTTPVSATTPKSDKTPPTVPTGFTATAASSTAVSLSWTASTDDVGVALYRVYRNNVSFSFTTATTFLDIARSPSTTYSYSVTACDATGNCSSNSAAASARTLASSTGTSTGTLPSSAAAAALVCQAQPYLGGAGDPQFDSFAQIAQFDGCMHRAGYPQYDAEGVSVCNILEGLLNATGGTWRSRYCPYKP